MNLQAWLHRRWYGGVAPNLLLRGLAAVYALLLRWRPVPAPAELPAKVLVVGNFTAGGSGKTPLVIALAQRLSARWRVGIVSRGYGRRESAPVRVRSGTPAGHCGDEPLLIHLRTGLPVEVDGDRVAAARRLVAEGCQLIIADDGLQHRRLPRQIEIEVVDGERGYGNGRLLPAGPLREAPRPVDFRVSNGGAPVPDAWTMRLEQGRPHRLSDGDERDWQSFAGEVHAVAGIGHPDRFFSALRAHGLDIAGHAFPDHHRYTAADLRWPVPLLMTEKDAVKCRDLAPAESYAVPVRAELPEEFFREIERRLEAADGGPA
jgi:tetraacyldisaccharide 4'-kinase